MFQGVSLGYCQIDPRYIEDAAHGVGCSRQALQRDGHEYRELLRFAEGRIASKDEVRAGTRRKVGLSGHVLLRMRRVS